MLLRQLLLMVMLLLTGIISGQFTRSSYTYSDGLPDDNVTCFRQDREGFLWIGTTNGLCRFDGTHFYIFPSGLLNSNKLSGDLILDLEEDGDHIWVSHRFGLSRVNKFSFHCENFQSPDSGIRYTIDRAIRDIYKDSQGTIWLAGDRQLLRFDKTSGSIKYVWDFGKNRPKGASSQLSKIIPAGVNRLLLYMVNGWVEYDIKENKPGTRLLRTIPIAYMKGENLRLRSYWNTFISNFFVWYDTGKGNMTISLSDSAGAIMQVKNIYIDSNLTLYTNSEKKKVTAWKKDNTLFRSNASDKIQDNIRLQEFNFGCSINGLQCWGSPTGLFINSNRSAWANEYFFSVRDGGMTLRPFGIRHVMEYDDDHWLVAADGGMFRVNRVTHEVHPYPQWTDSSVYTMQVMPDRSLWLSTDRFLYQYYPDNGKILRRIFIDSYAMSLHYFDRKLLVATRSSGILLLDLDRYTLVKISAKDPIKKINNDRITSVKQAGNSGSFIITYNFPGHYSRNNFNTGEYLPDSIPAAASVFNEQFALTSVQTGYKQLWLGQYVGGVVMYDSTSGTWTNFTSQTGLSSNYINEILMDRSGRTWIVTDRGIDIYDSVKKNFYKFPLLLRSGGRTGGFISRKGTLVFFDGEKIIETDPRLFNLEPENRKILFSRVIQGDQQMNIRESSLKLPYHKNSLNIIFSLQKLEPSVKTRYGYRLSDKDGWTDIGTETELNFASMQPGTYHLRLRATDEFGQWSHYSGILSIRILPPFWKTWWFFLLVALFLTGLLWMIYRYRIRQLRKILAMRTKISQDLHDEVGATLSGVTLMSELANEKLKTRNTGETQSIIERITTESKEMAEKMNDIVWTINPVNDSMEKVLNKIQGYGINICASRNIQFHFTRPEAREEISLNMQIRNTIYMISKEAINNAVKYSGAGNIRFSLSGKRNNYALTISDDGAGFDTAGSYTGNGLVNMKARAAEIGGQLTIESDAENGTHIRLRF